MKSSRVRNLHGEYENIIKLQGVRRKVYGCCMVDIEQAERAILTRCNDTGHYLSQLAAFRGCL